MGSSNFLNASNLSLEGVCKFFVYSHFSFNKTVDFNSFVSTCNNYIDLSFEFKLASI